MVTEINLKHVYVALSRIVSTSLVDKDLFFGSILPAVEKEIAFEDCPVSISNLLHLLKDNFHASKYDLTWFHQEVQLLLAELVRHERAEPPDTRENAAGRDRTAEHKNKQKALAIILYL
ncbi:hypothetical protein MVEG_08225 [Podila verticillata NRRL 6337]|nr:hypothetical protein MVEG_08225 [Podila verticillata NRRL 6337]